MQLIIWASINDLRGTWKLGDFICAFENVSDIYTEKQPLSEYL